MSDTTRRFPRTAAEAFRGPDYADPIEPPPKKHRIADVTFGLALAVVVALTLLVLVLFPGAPT